MAARRSTQSPTPPAPASPPPDAFAVVGSLGLSKVGGSLTEDWNPQLRGERWTRTVREMVEGDAVVGAVLFMIEMLVRRADWRTEPADEGTEAQQVADFVEGARHDMDATWPDTLGEILTFLAYGWSWFEVTYKRRDGFVADPVYGETWDSQHDDGKVGWGTWAPRPQDTLLSWDFDPLGQSILGMVQSAPPTYGPVTIPRAKSLHFRTTSRKGSPEGQSILRRCWFDWHMKRHIQRIEGIGIERDLAGLPVMYVPNEILQGQTAAATTARDSYKGLIRNLKRDEQEGVLLSSARDEHGQLTHELKLLSTGGTRSFNTGEVISRYNQQIAMSALADVILIGHEQNGTQALAIEKAKMLTTALEAWMAVICATVTAQAIRPLLRLNGIDPKLTPRLANGDIAAVDLADMGAYVLNLSNAGIDVTAPDMQAHLFGLAGLPVAIQTDEQQAESGKGTRTPDGTPAPEADGAPPTAKAKAVDAAAEKPKVRPAFQAAEPKRRRAAVDAAVEDDARNLWDRLMRDRKGLLDGGGA